MGGGVSALCACRGQIDISFVGCTLNLCCFMCQCSAVSAATQMHVVRAISGLGTTGRRLVAAELGVCLLCISSL